VTAAAAPGTDRYRNGLEVFRAGDLDGAAAIWEALLAEEHRNAYTLLLMTACSGDTVRGAQRTFSAQRLYLVAKMLKGRGCFRVCLGTFDSREAAARALAGLPREYHAGGAAVRPVADVLTRDRPQR
jgi:septal ring-binding cell division protein DamX